MANKQKQMLAVWGSPGAGKTVTAVKLAAELAKRKKNVVLVFTDLTAPPLPAVAAGGKLPEVSVGELLSAPGMTQEQVLKTCVPCEKHPYISFLGYKAGENVFTYAEYSKEKAVDMLVLLRHIADYVIVDCTSLLTGNVLATTALEVAASTSGNVRLFLLVLKNRSILLAISEHLPGNSGNDRLIGLGLFTGKRFQQVQRRRLFLQRREIRR